MTEPVPQLPSEAQALAIATAAAEAQVAAEKKAGLRCFGCGDRIEQGLEFITFNASFEAMFRGEAQGPVMQTLRAFGCDGSGDEGKCDFAVAAAASATVMRRVENVWLEVEGTDAAVPATSPLS